jgi:hypothetical protein
MASSGMLFHVALVRTDVSEERSASIVWVTGYLFLCSMRRKLVTANDVRSSPILVSLMMVVYIPPKCQFLQQPHGVTSQKTPFLTGRWPSVCWEFTIRPLGMPPTSLAWVIHGEIRDGVISGFNKGLTLEGRTGGVWHSSRCMMTARNLLANCSFADQNPLSLSLYVLGAWRPGGPLLIYLHKVKF